MTQNPTPVSIPLSSTGEIVDIPDADQFQPSKSQFECGFFAIALCLAMAQVGKPPTLSVAQVIADAESWYAQYDGSDAITNTAGMSVTQEQELLTQVHLHWQQTATDITTVKKWVQAGYLVLLAIAETSVRDLVLGDTNPYPWTPAGTHIITVTGVRSDGNVLVRDSANCTSLADPSSLRPGPRSYNAAALQIVSACVVVPPWLPRPTSATPPIQAPTPSAALSSQNQAALAEWNSFALLGKGVTIPGVTLPPFPTSTNIYARWLADYKRSIFHGPPLFGISNVDWHGNPIAVLYCLGARFEDRGGIVSVYTLV